MAVFFWLKNPRMGLARIKYWLWERANPEKPWMCMGTIAFCESNLDKSMEGIEFGSGRSTRWFAGKLGRLISVEHNTDWHQEVTTQLRMANIENVDYRLIPLDHPESEPEHESYPSPPPMSPWSTPCRTKVSISPWLTDITERRVLSA